MAQFLSSILLQSQQFLMIVVSLQKSSFLIKNSIHIVEEPFQNTLQIAFLLPAGAPTSSLQCLYNEGDNNEWNLLETPIVIENGIATCTTSHFSTFAVGNTNNQTVNINVILSSFPI